MMVKARFRIVTCTSGFVKFVDLDIPADNVGREGFDIATDYRGDVLSAGGVRLWVCESCYDDSYRVEFVGYIKSEG